MQITGTHIEGVLTLYLKGELDHHAAKESMQKIGKEIDINLPTQCVLDFSDLSFMDSSGIALVLNTYKRMEEIGGSAKVVSVPRQARKVLDAAGISRIVPIESDALQGGHVSV